MNDSPQQRARWGIVSLVYLREMRDQLRDRRTLFTIVVLPLVLYPVLGSLMLQVAQFSRTQAASVCIVGSEYLPEQPKLLEAGGTFSSAYSNEADSLDVVLQPVETELTPEQLRERVESWVHGGLFQVALHVTPEDAEPEEAEAQRLKIDVIFNVASDGSRAARTRVLQVLDLWRQDWVELRLDEADVDTSVLRPLTLSATDVAPPRAGETTLWSKLLPFVMLVWALTGAFYPAIDLVAGEKERGTLETLLCSPALRSEIVMGKMAAVMTFSLITAVLNVASMLVTALFVSRQVFASGPLGAAIGPPAPGPLLWLLVALLPLSALFSALALAVAALARSSKEGQYYLMPLMMLALPLVMLPMLPGAELNAGNSLIPVSGMFLLTRALMEGQYVTALMHLPLVVMVTGACLWLATRWAGRQFEDESVLFRGGDQWNLGTWVRHLWRDRHGEATVGQAFGCAAIILVGLFFAKLVVTTMPTNFVEVARLVTIPQLALILAPTLLMASFLTRSLRRSLNLHRPPGLTLPVAVLLGVCLHPAYTVLGHLIQTIYPISSEAAAALQPFEQIVNGAPFWAVVLVLAIVPAVCEELAYRGFIFNGLRQNNAGLRAVLVTAVLFGLSHGVLQQSLAATVMGLLLGWITLRSGSLIPALIVHVLNNTLSVSLGRVGQLEGGWVKHVFDFSGEVPHYSTGWTLLSAAVATSCLIYFSVVRPREQVEESMEGEVADREAARGAITGTSAS